MWANRTTAGAGVAFLEQFSERRRGKGHDGQLDSWMRVAYAIDVAGALDG